MANEQLPAYLASAQPNPPSNRGPWYANTAPAYFGIFMWIAFYNNLGGALKLGGLGATLLGLVLAAFISHYLFHYVFGILGMRTGLPLYVVGSSTFGTKGGYLFPGVFMGLLQIGWYSVGTYFATDLVLQAFGQTSSTLYGPGSGEFSAMFIVVAIAWGYIFATFGAFGIQYVAKVSTYLPWIALAMLVIAVIGAIPYIGDFKTPEMTQIGGLAAACAVIQMVIGFFATAGAAGVDFGTASRNAGDVNKGGLTGISLAIIVAGGLAIVTTAGAQGKFAKEQMQSAETVATASATAPETAGAELTASPAPKEAPKFELAASLPEVSPSMAKLMFLFLAIGSMAPACFCSSIIGNSLSTMIPSLPRVPLTLGGATIGIILAALGVAGNLVPFFGLIGASFGPICGAMVADYLLSGKKWTGPREGVSIAGYGAWIVGFLVGISNNGVVSGMFRRTLVPDWQPTAVYSFIVGFVVYYILASAGLQGKPVAYGPASQQQQG